MSHAERLAVPEENQRALKEYLNIGCGNRFHAAWTNIDIISTSRGVRRYDIRCGIPFAPNTFKVVYHSHLLEHLPKNEAGAFMRECYRVLKPGGIIRVVLPDLERIARLYLRAVDQAAAGSNEWQHHHAWLLLEMYDQTVRERAGGEMLEYLRQVPIPNEEFVCQRLGSEARRLVQMGLSGSTEPDCGHSRFSDWRSRVLALPHKIRAKAVRWFLGEHDYKALQIGRFRLAGEVHHWMYDRFSLALLLEQCGLEKPVQRGAFDSAIPDWPRFNLDSEPDGTIYKPDSMYFEAVKSASEFTNASSREPKAGVRAGAYFA